MALHTVSGFFRVTKCAWAPPTRLARALARSAIAQQSCVLYSTPSQSDTEELWSEFCWRAMLATAIAEHEWRAAGLIPYDKLVGKLKSPNGILTVPADAVEAKTEGRYAGALLCNEPAGTIHRLRLLDKDKMIQHAINIAREASSVHDKEEAEGSSFSSRTSSRSMVADSVKDHSLVFQPLHIPIWANSKQDLMKPGDRNIIVLEVDLFKIPKQLLMPFMSSTTPGVPAAAAEAAPIVPATTEGSHPVQQAVVAAIQAGKAAGPFATVGSASLAQLVRDITAARMTVRRSSSNISSNGDLCCRVDRVPVDTSEEYQQAAAQAALGSGNKGKPPKNAFVVTVYPCPRWPKAPRLSRIGAVLASAAAAT